MGESNHTFQACEVDIFYYDKAEESLIFNFANKTLHRIRVFFIKASFWHLAAVDLLRITKWRTHDFGGSMDVGHAVSNECFCAYIWMF